MSSVLSFTEAFRLTTPTIDGLPDGVLLQMWVRRTGDGAPRSMIELAGATTKILLGPGDRADILRLAVFVDGVMTAIAIPGGLPVDRWVQVRATIAANGAATLAVRGVTTVSGTLPAPGSEPRTGKLGGFVGELSQVQLWRHPAPTMLSWAPPVLNSPRLWAYYPLERTDYDATRKLHVSADAGPNRRDATETDPPPVVTRDAPLADGPAHCMVFAEDTEDTRLAPMGALSGQLTLEAWVRLDAEDDKPVSVLQLAGAPELALIAGGKDREVGLAMSNRDLMSVTGSSTTRLVTVKNAITPGQWCHIAVTLTWVDHQNEATIHVQGALRETRTIRGDAYAKLLIDPRSLVQRAIVPGARLAGQAPQLARFRGAIAEARVWSTASRDRLEAMWLTRARGDEDDLLACYRLDAGARRWIDDISPRRAQGRAAPGVTIDASHGPPLANTGDATPFRVTVRGKLVRDWAPPLGSNEKLRDATYFDASIEAVGRDGDATARAVEVRVDRPLLCYRNSSNTPSLWVPGRTFVVALSPAGRVRLRFPANHLTGPTIRARVAGAPGGVWTVIRPDAPVQARLGALTGAELKDPGDDRTTPLSADTSRSDADALASACRQLASQFTGVVVSKPSTALAIVTEAANELADQLANQMTSKPTSEVSQLNNRLNGQFKYATIAAPRPATALPTGASSRSFLDDGADWASDTWDAGKDWADEQIDKVDPARLGNTLLDTTSGVIAGATRAAKTAGQLVASAADDLDALRKKAEGATLRAGTTAIKALIDSADVLALETNHIGAASLGWIEVIGTTIVDGAETAWRVVVSGADEALAAIEALIHRIGAEIQKIIDFIAYLFMWDDFLAASDDIYALLESNLAQLQTTIPTLDEYQQKLCDTLRTGVEQALGKRSVGDLLGLDADATRTAMEPLEYVLEKLQDALDSVDLSFDDGGAVGADRSPPSSAQIACADQVSGKLPGARLTGVTTLLTTPVADLVAGNGALADGSGSLLDTLFTDVTTRGAAAMKLADQQFRARINVPWLTRTIEKTVLGDRTFSLMRVTALMAAIGLVLARKAGNSGAASRTTTATTAKSSTAIATRSDTGFETRDSDATAKHNPSDHDALLWASMSLGLVNTLLLGAKTGLEIASKSVSAKTMGVVIGVGGLCVSVRGILTFARMPSMPVKTLPYVGINAGLEIVAGVWMGLSAYSNYAVPDNDYWRKVDLVVYGTLGLATLGCSAVAMATGNLQGDSQIISFSLRCGSWVSGAMMRLSEKYDDSDPTRRLKWVTVGFGVLAGATDVAEAIYGNVNDFSE